MRRIVFLLAIVGVLLSLSVLTAYVAFPQLAGWLAAREAHRIGLTDLTVRTERPGLDGLRIGALGAASSEFAVQLRDVQLSWSWESLRQGRLLAVAVASASIVVLRGGGGPGPATGGGEETQRAPGALKTAVAGAFQRLPFDQAEIAALSVEVPVLGLAAGGSANYGDDRLTVHLEARSPEKARGLDAAATIAASGELAVSVREADGEALVQLTSVLPEDELTVDATVNLSGFGWRTLSVMAGLPSGEGRLTGQWRLTAPWPPEGGLDWRVVSGSGPFTLVWASADGHLSVPELKGDMQLSDGVLTAAVSGRLHGKWDATVLEAQPTQVRVALAGPSVETSGRVRLTSDGADLDGDATASLASGGTDEPQDRLEARISGTADTAAGRFPVVLDATGRLSRTRLEGRVNLSTGLIHDMPVDVVYDLAQAVTTLSIDHRLRFDRPLLAGVLPGWEADYDLDQGVANVRLSARKASGADLTGSGSVRLDGVSAHVDAAAIRGLAGDLAIRFEHGVPRLETSALGAALVDFGVPIRDVATTVAGDADRLHVGATTASVLGGTLSVDPFDFLVAEGRAETKLVLSDLDLAAVLALEGKHIGGSGRIDGTIPIRFADGAVVVTDGRLVARAPGGMLRLSPNVTGAITQPGLDVALGALTDFRFDVLEADVDYAPNGDMALGIRLEGRNPDVESGRPIHYNLNISENVPVLLKSLRLQDAFTRRIEQRVLR